MELLLAVTGVAVTVVVTWLFGRHYYLKTRADNTTMTAFLEAVRQQQQEFDNPDLQQEQPVYSSQFAKRWALRLIDAYEKHEILSPELSIACRTMKQVSDLFGSAYEAANEAVAEGEMPQPTSPRWFELRRQAFDSELIKIRDRLRRELELGG